MADNLNKREARRAMLLAWTEDGRSPDFKAMARLLRNLGYYDTKTSPQSVEEHLEGTWRLMREERRLEWHRRNPRLCPVCDGARRVAYQTLPGEKPGTRNCPRCNKNGHNKPTE